MINKVIYIPDIDKIAFYEESSDEIFLMNHETGTLHNRFLMVLPEPEKVHVTAVRKL